MKAAHKFDVHQVTNIPTKTTPSPFSTWQRHGYYTCINWKSGRAVTLTQPGLRCLATWIRCGLWQD